MLLLFLRQIRIAQIRDHTELRGQFDWLCVGHPTWDQFEVTQSLLQFEMFDLEMNQTVHLVLNTTVSTLCCLFSIF